MEKWLRKRPPMEPNLPEAKGVNVVEQDDPLAEAKIEVENAVAQESIEPLIHNDAIPDIVDAETNGSVQVARGGGVFSFAAHLGSLENFPLTPPFVPVTKMPLESSPSLDSPLQNLRVSDTSFVGRPAVKRKKTMHGDGGSLDAAGEVTHLGHDLVGMGGHPLVEGHAELEV
ncbi:hypothetical protein RHGRI_026625 [Rhododendron griersonianum]|uniref:Uncharacterized protein n=1 Tax=Rhododendron griersonianum TaxID=479676 RepID=A0AAV6IU42_9ERIC|nr:hypothetical protein RHGRI_026625 [Rhododendron griersonianum]